MTATQNCICSPSTADVLIVQDRYCDFCIRPISWSVEEESFVVQIDIQYGLWSRAVVCHIPPCLLNCLGPQRTWRIHVLSLELLNGCWAWQQLQALPEVKSTWINPISRGQAAGDLSLVYWKIFVLYILRSTRCCPQTFMGLQCLSPRGETVENTTSAPEDAENGMRNHVFESFWGTLLRIWRGSRRSLVTLDIL